MLTRVEKSTRFPWKITGVCLMVVSVVQMAISSRAYDLTHYSLGSWWSGATVFLCGICGLLSHERHAAAASLMFCLLGFIFCAFGAIDDGINSTVFRDFDVCYNPYTHKVYGEEVTGHTLPCMVNLINSNVTYTHRYNCVCASNGNHEKRACVDVRLQHDSDHCEVLMTQMPALLLTSCMLLLVMLLLLIGYCCLACKCVDCNGDMTVHPIYLDPPQAEASYREVCGSNDIETPTAVANVVSAMSHTSMENDAIPVESADFVRVRGEEQQGINVGSTRAVPTFPTQEDRSTIPL